MARRRQETARTGEVLSHSAMVRYTGSSCGVRETSSWLGLMQVSWCFVMVMLFVVFEKYMAWILEMVGLGLGEFCWFMNSSPHHLIGFKFFFTENFVSIVSFLVCFSAGFTHFKSHCQYVEPCQMPCVGSFWQSNEQHRSGAHFLTDANWDSIEGVMNSSL
jgi:hypothetical protein